MEVQGQETLEERLAGMRLGQIGTLIAREWQPMFFAAVPYVSAMRELANITDEFGPESGKSIVLYFLSNASTWRGETARAVKRELKARVAGLSAKQQAYTRQSKEW